MFEEEIGESQGPGGEISVGKAEQLPIGGGVDDCGSGRLDLRSALEEECR